MQSANFVKREVNGVPLAVLALALGKDFLDRGGGLEVDVVQADKATVLREGEVLLDVMRPHAIGQGVGLERVLRHIAAGPTMGDDDLAGFGMGAKG